MRKLFLTLFIATAMSVLTLASSEAQFTPTSGLTISPFGGVRSLHLDDVETVNGADIDYDWGYLVGVGIGFDAQTNILPEIEFSYSNNEFEDDTANVDAEIGFFSILAKVYYNLLPPNFPFMLYTGVSAGWSRVEIKIDEGDTDMSETENHFTYGTSVGFKVPLGGSLPNVYAGIQYDILGYDDNPDFSSGVTGRLYYSF